MSELSRTINPHDEDECNELNHFDKSGHDNHNHEHDDDDDDEKLISNDVKKRKMSHVDITFIDKDDDADDKDKDDKKEDDQKIGPNAMVDILA